MECKKQTKKTIFSHFAECNGHDTRQSDYLGTCFAECTGHCTRQTSQVCRVRRARHSAKVACLPSVLTGHSANRLPLPSVLLVALGTVATFAECLSQRRSANFAECLTLTLSKATVMVALAVTATFLLPSVRLALGKGFAECPIKCTRQRRLYR